MRSCQAGLCLPVFGAGFARLVGREAYTTTVRAATC